MIVSLIKVLVIALATMVLAACMTTTQNNSSGNYRESALKERARAHSDLAAAYFQQNKYEIALTEFTEATKIDPTYSPAYNGLGLVYAALGEDAKADANFLKAIQVQPNSSEAHNNYGSFLCARKRYDESIPHFLAAVKNPLYPTPNLAYANAGICSARKNDTKSAEIYLNKALQLQPLTYSAAYQLAEIQFKRGEVKTAKSTLQNVIIASPTPESLWLAIRIERLLGGRDNEASYALQLRQQYPDSEQTRLLLSGQ
ncbi:MAG: type IV pilus biogenesis/stability protein PilW [Pseudomonadota bacterium]